MTGRVEKPGTGELHARAAAVKLLVLDVDGVLTDGGLYYGPSGEALKRFDVKDGHGIVMARLAGLRTAVLTARQSEMVAVRGRELGMVAVYQGRRDKAAGFRELCAELQVSPPECAYMGDDTNDLPVLELCGLPACPANAVPEVRAAAAFIARAPGGHGAVRELVELCLKASGLWEAALSHATGAHAPRR